MGLHPFLLVMFGTLAGLACAQHEPAAAHGKSPPPPVHQPLPELPPRAALSHLRAGNLLFRQALARHEGPQRPPARPAGAGRFVAAVVVCADAGVDAPYLFSLEPRDTLLLSTAAAQLGVGEVAQLERAVQQERLSLVVVLAHTDCDSLQPGPATTPAQRAAAQATAAARALAEQRQLPLAHAAALQSVETLLGSSELLTAQVEAGKLLVAPAAVDPKSGAITWLLTRAQEMPLPPTPAK